MAPRPGELEVLVPLADSGGEHEAGRDGPAKAGATHRPRRRRWPIGVLAAAIAVVAIAVPVRTRLGRSELRWLDRQWARSLADDGERHDAEQRIKSYSLVADQARLNTAVASLYHEEVQRFHRARTQLGRALLVDLRLAGVRSDIVSALSHRSDLLARVAAWYDRPREGSAPPNADNQTAGDTIRVDHALRAARTHWGQKMPAAGLPAAPFASATPVLAQLSHWFDQPLGVSLLTVSGDRLLRLDIDASRSAPIGGISITGTVIARQGYLAYSSDGKVWAVAPDGSGTPKPLATGDNFFAAAEPNAIWVEDPANLAVTEVDGAGRVLTAPLSVPGQALNATSRALIVSPPDQSAIQVWDRTTRRVTCRLGADVPPNRSGFAPIAFASVLATRGNLVAWVDPVPQLHVTDASTCQDRERLAMRAQSQVSPAMGPAVAFSPDGRTLAVAGVQVLPADGVYPLDLIDLASGHATAVPVQPRLSIDSIVWTGDGSRLFWLSGGQFGFPPLIDTWRVGDPRSQTLRAIDLRGGAPLLVVPK